MTDNREQVIDKKSPSQQKLCSIAFIPKISTVESSVTLSHFECLNTRP